MTDKWHTILQIADYLQVSKEKIYSLRTADSTNTDAAVLTDRRQYKLCQRRRIPGSKVGGQGRFDIKEVDAWVRQQRPREQDEKLNGSLSGI